MTLSIIKGEFGMEINWDKETLRQYIIDLVVNAEGNHFGAIGHEELTMWDAPMVGFSACSDPYFSFFKEDIGPFYWTPAEAYSLRRLQDKTTDQDLTCISLVFPQTERTKVEQSDQKDSPGSYWINSRNTWEAYMQSVCNKIVDGLTTEGIRSVAIDLLPEVVWLTSERYGYAARWSHRHAAFVSGLGTFGLSDGLITIRGKAMRCTTILAMMSVEPDARKYETHTEWCSYYRDGSCGVCIDRCPIGAITKNGHDKVACKAYEDRLRETMIIEGRMQPPYMLCCGLCQTGVPCQDRVPVTLK
jgi:ferredoxin